MLKILFLSSFLTANLFAGTVILEKQAISGYVMPEHSFVKKCSILSKGYMESTIVRGDGAVTSVAKQLSKRKMYWIKILLAKAKSGVVEVLPYPCDAGTTVLKGWIQGELVELDNAQDCGERRLNNSHTVEVLKKFSESICGF